MIYLDYFVKTPTGNKMQYLTHLKVYITGQANFHPDSVLAYSNQRRFVQKRRDGKVVFNNYFCSTTTKKDQNEIRKLMTKLGIKIDLELYYTSMSLFHLHKDVYQDEIKLSLLEIKKLKKLTASERTKKATNEKYLLKIQELRQHVKKVTTLL